jgi:hypothetical protein
MNRTMVGLLIMVSFCATSSGGAVTVVVLEPEVVDVEGGSDHRATLAEAVSRTLTEKLAAQPKAYTHIDR